MWSLTLVEKFVYASYKRPRKLCSRFDRRHMQHTCTVNEDNPGTVREKTKIVEMPITLSRIGWPRNRVICRATSDTSVGDTSWSKKWHACRRGQLSVDWHGGILSSSCLADKTKWTSHERCRHCKGSTFDLAFWLTSHALIAITHVAMT